MLCSSALRFVFRFFLPTLALFTRSGVLLLFFPSSCFSNVCHIPCGGGTMVCFFFFFFSFFPFFSFDLPSRGLFFSFFSICLKCRYFLEETAKQSTLCSCFSLVLEDFVHDVALLPYYYCLYWIYVATQYLWVAYLCDHRTCVSSINTRCVCSSH